MAFAIRIASRAVSSALHATEKKLSRNYKSDIAVLEEEVKDSKGSSQVLTIAALAFAALSLFVYHSSKKPVPALLLSGLSGAVGWFSYNLRKWSQNLDAVIHDNSKFQKYWGRALAVAYSKERKIQDLTKELKPGTILFDRMTKNFAEVLIEKEFREEKTES